MSKQETPEVLEEEQTIKDMEYALEVLHDLSKIDETKLYTSPVMVNAGKMRDCLQLMLSLLEHHEGRDVQSMEIFVHLCRNNIPNPTPYVECAVMQ